MCEGGREAEEEEGSGISFPLQHLLHFASVLRSLNSVGFFACLPLLVFFSFLQPTR